MRKSVLTQSNAGCKRCSGSTSASSAAAGVRARHHTPHTVVATASSAVGALSLVLALLLGTIVRHL